MNRTLALLAVLIAPSFAGDFYGKDEASPYGKEPGLERLAQSQTTASKHLSIGEPVQVGGVTVYPVIDESAPKVVSGELDSFSEAMADGALIVSENKGQGGSYTNLMLTNHSKEPVLVMAGEVVRGGRQDRIFTEDLIIPPDSGPQMVQVHCVEKGRWSDAAATFSYGGRAELALRNATKSGQDTTWAAIAAMNTARGGSATGAYIATNGPEMLQYRQTLRSAIGAQHQVVGAVIAQGTQIVHAEIFGDPQLAEVGRTTLLDGYALDAVVMDDLEPIAPDPEAAALYLQQALTGSASLHVIDVD
ncbi:MAG: hypothetical protein P8R54_26225 [Myxococcota bacterium]|nr:hypothetical protein [Myxococcota bacterium]